MSKRILLFVEDPGAALFLKELPAALIRAGHRPLVLASPLAAPYFALVMPIPAVRSADAAAVLSEHSPDALVVGTSENVDSFAFPLLAAAGTASLPSFGAVDSAANAEHRFRARTSDPLAFLPDHLLVPDRATMNAFLQLGVADERITVCGHPQLHAIGGLREAWGEPERQAHRSRWFPGVEPGRPIMVFVSELSDGLGENLYCRAPDYRLQGTSGSDARSDIVAEEFLLAARELPSRPYLVLRLHPKQIAADEARLAALFDQVSQAEPALEVAHAADRVIGMTSILLAEAAMLGRPVLSIVPRPLEREWLGEMADAIPCVWERADIAARLAMVPDPVPDSAVSTADPVEVMCDRILAAEECP